MRWMIFVLAFLQDEQQLQLQSNNEEAAREAKIINANIDLLSDSDDKVRKIAQDYLILKGIKVIPFIEQRLRERKAHDLYQMIKTIELKATPEMPAAAANVDPALAKFADLASKIKPPERNAVDQVLLLKLSEAFSLITRGQLDAAEKIIIAIRTLDSGWKYNDWVIELHRYVQMKIIETKFMKPTAEPKTEVVTLGEPVEITVRLHNIHKQPLTISKYELAKPILFAEYRATAMEFDGSIEEHRDTKTFDMPDKIVIDPEKTWENAIRIDTKEFHPDKNLYREYSISMITTFVNFESAEEKGVRKLAFPTVTVKVIPAKYAGYVADPIKSLTELLGEQGAENDAKVQDVYIAVLLCKGDKDRVYRANELLIPLLDKNRTAEGFTVLIRLLEHLNDARIERSKEAWEKWWKEASAKPAKK
jgi:hypothetical protein